MSGHRHLRNFIAGEYVDGRTDSTTDIVNPATGAVVAQAPVSGQDDAYPMCGYWSCRCGRQQVGADEVRARHLMVEAIARFGWGRSL